VSKRGTKGVGARAGPAFSPTRGAKVARRAGFGRARFVHDRPAMKTTATLSFIALTALVTSTVAHAQAEGYYPEEIRADPYGSYGEQQAQSQPQPYDGADPRVAQQVSDDSVADGYDDGYDPEAYQQFEEPLAQAGAWTDDASYGRIWIPSPMVVGENFTPYYTAGHWVLSEYGWTWVSDWGWGWAPFHYGRWVVVAGRGWAWVPGRVWGPAWVAWRSGDGYVGWAPLPPRGVRIAAYGSGVSSPWRFTVAGNLGAPRPICVPRNQVPAVFARTAVLASNRIVTRGTWQTRINAGPVNVARATPVRLAIVSPHAGPRYAIAPRPMPHAKPASPPRFQPAPEPRPEPRFRPAPPSQRRPEMPIPAFRRWR
jgi:hypothetical protein